jgi:hypothetical protein
MAAVTPLLCGVLNEQRADCPQGEHSIGMA